MAPVTPEKRPDRVGGALAYALSAYLAWGLSPVYFKSLRPSGPLEILSWRVVASVALLAVMTLALGRAAEVRRSLADGRRAATFAVTTLLISVNWLLYIWSVNTGHLLEASLGYFMNPLVTILLGVVFLKEGLDRRQRIAVALAGAGVAYMVISAGRLPWISLALAFSFALYTLLRKKAHIDAVAGLLVETALLAPFAVGWLVHLHRRGEGHFGTSVGMSALLLSAGLVTALPLVWFTLGVHRLRLSTIGLLQYVAPTLQFSLAVLAYGEPFGRTQAVTFALIWAGLALYTVDAVAKARGREAGPPPEVDPLD